MASRPSSAAARPIDSAKLIATLIDTQRTSSSAMVTPSYWPGDPAQDALYPILDMHNVKPSGNGASSAHSWEN